MGDTALNFETFDYGSPDATPAAPYSNNGPSMATFEPMTPVRAQQESYKRHYSVIMTYDQAQGAPQVYGNINSGGSFGGGAGFGEEPPLLEGTSSWSCSTVWVLSHTV